MTFEEMSLDDKIDNLKMRIRGFKNRHKETLYKEDGRNKNMPTEMTCAPVVPITPLVRHLRRSPRNAHKEIPLGRELRM